MQSVQKLNFESHNLVQGSASSQSISEIAAFLLRDSRPPARNLNLDFLRGIAVLMVVAFHSFQMNEQLSGAKVWNAVFGSMWTGVDLFFVLSGFLITGILLDSRNDANFFSRFYLRRALRILPLYYGVLVVVLVILPLLWPRLRQSGNWQLLSLHQLWLWTYTNNFLQATEPHTLPGFGHFWTLAIEEQFYLGWPLLVFFLGKRIRSLAVALCIAEPAVRMWMLHQGWSVWSIRQLTFCRLDGFAYGAVMAILIRETSDSKHVRLWLAFAVSGLAAMVIRDGRFLYDSALTATIGYSLFELFFACVIYLLFRAPSVQGKLAQALARLGTLGYGVYVFHWPIAATIMDMKMNRSYAGTLAAFVLTLGSSVGLAWISWHLWEGPFLRLRDISSRCQEPDGG